MNQLLSAVETTSFSTGCCPAPAISIPAPADETDYNSVAAVEAALAAERLNAAAAARDAAEVVAEGAAADEGSVEMSDYLIYCVTGDAVNAGTNANIHISIVGTTGRTPYMKLRKLLKTSLSRGDKTTFVLRDRPVGLVRYVQLYNDGKTPDSNWFISYIVLSTPYNNKCYTLPCYRWLTGRSLLSLRDGTAVTAGGEVEEMMMLRALEASDKQQQITWRDQTDETTYTDLPGYIAAGCDVSKLPIDLLTDEAKNLDKRWADHNDSKSSIMKSFLRLFTSRKGSLTVAYEKQLADSTEKKYQNRKELVYILRHWREDEVFARQLLIGTHPSQITRLYEIPESFDVNHSTVREQLQQGRSLQQELEDGKVFMISYPELKEFAKLCFADDLNGDSGPKRKKSTKDPVRYISSPSVLLYLKQEGGSSVLLPLAILVNTPSSSSSSSSRLHHTWDDIPEPPQVTSTVYTRRDDVGDEYTDWLVAKMWVRVADLHYHILGSLIASRLLAETVSLAVYRCLPSVHPVFKLLAPHLADVASLNTVYRRRVLDAVRGVAQSLALGDRNRGLCVKFVSERLHAMSLQMLDQRQSFSKLGPYAAALNDYWYRDDSLELWDAIWTFVEQVLSLYYDDDVAVISDIELTAMLAELRQHSITALGMSQNFFSLEALTQFVTIVIFTCTVQQTALRRTMLDKFAYCPNAPPCMMTPPPSERHEDGLKEQQVSEMLPDTELVDYFIGDVLMLAGSDVPTSESLLNYKNPWFTEEAPQKIMDQFRSSLRQISDKMKRRNKDLETPFEYLLPEKVYMRFNV